MLIVLLKGAYSEGAAGDVWGWEWMIWKTGRYNAKTLRRKDLHTVFSNLIFLRLGDSASLRILLHDYWVGLVFQDVAVVVAKLFEEVGCGVSRIVRVNCVREGKDG